MEKNGPSLSPLSGTWILTCPIRGTAHPLPWTASTFSISSRSIKKPEKQFGKLTDQLSGLTWSLMEKYEEMVI